MTENERRRKASDEKIESLLSVYYSGKYDNTAQFIRDYNLNTSTFFSFLKRNNLNSLQSTTRKYDIDVHYFDTIDSEEKAYWLGFLQCDSYITDTLMEVCLCIADRGHLEKLKRCIKYNGNIIERLVNNKYNSCRLTITSKDFVRPFTYIGLDKFKSKTMRFLMRCDNILFKHYVRGIIDANGSISISVTKNGFYKVYLDVTSGSEKFIYELSNELEKYYELHNSTNITKDKRSLTYRCYFKKSLYSKIFEDVYKYATISLDRKQEKVNAVLYGSAKNI